ncbi:hypothetical protein Rs2_21672 [Raphanus sativus]|uniref:Uncharacterized protein LOC108858389 n=1 Tax=Raphanus sativus TaxID=3726 RepID=A0A6J0NUL0_RAPSA|nr:uncharacterized protein LOC108858389 [Raphanus sativus]KAJ4894878.1 hypothetical protein Rs2_21672 [Raphanus sativus]
MDRDLWKAMQNLNIGSNLQPLRLSRDTQRRNATANRLSLVVRGLNPAHQNLTGMRNTLPKAWRLHDRVRGQINDDGTIQFFFTEEHNLLSVIDRGPWSFKDWMVIMDPWYRRGNPNFLTTISFWVQIYNIPNEYRNQEVVEEIGRELGHLEGLRIVEPTRDNLSEVWVRIRFDAYQPLTFTRYIHFEEGRDQVLLRFEYERLKKFCVTCGRLTHERMECGHVLPQPQQLIEQNEEEQLGQQINPQQQDQEQALAEGEQLMVEKEEAESPIEQVDHDEEENLDQIHIAEYMQDVTQLLLNQGTPVSIPGISCPTTTFEIGSTSGADRGSKRKFEDIIYEDSYPARRQRIEETNDEDGLVVAIRPPPEP